MLVNTVNNKQLLNAKIWRMLATVFKKIKGTEGRNQFAFTDSTAGRI